MPFDGALSAQGQQNSSDINNNSIQGAFSIPYALTGSDNNAIVGDSVATVQGIIKNSVLVGHKTGNILATGSNKVIAIGYRAAYDATTPVNAIVIGNDISTPTPTASNSLNIANLLYANGLDGTGANISTGFFGIGVKSPLARLHVSSNLASSGITNTFISQHNYTTGNEEPMWVITNGGNTALWGISFPLKPNSSSLAIRFKTTSQGNGFTRCYAN
jgi:hypothetical protein